MPTQQMVRWRLLLEEFHPIVKHVAGKDNDAADALSRLDISDNNGFDETKWGEATKPLTYADKGKNPDVISHGLRRELAGQNISSCS